jgi:hypothetical protein
MVDFRPIVKPKPDRKRILPIAISPLSKKKMIPRNEKNTPKPVKPSPISGEDKTQKSQIIEILME